MSEKRQSLFSIGEEFLALRDLIRETIQALDDGEEITEHQKETLAEFTSELRTSLREKADSYAYVITEAKANALALKEEARRLMKRANTEANVADRLKAMLYDTMNSIGVRKFKTQLHSFGIQLNGGKQKVDVFVPPLDLPENYRVVRYEADNEALREALLAGEEIEGANLVARGESLRIR